MRVQFEKETQSRSNAHTIVELCVLKKKNKERKKNKKNNKKI